MVHRPRTKRSTLFGYLSFVVFSDFIVFDEFGCYSKMYILFDSGGYGGSCGYGRGVGVTAVCKVNFAWECMPKPVPIA